MRRGASYDGDNHRYCISASGVGILSHMAGLQASDAFYPHATDSVIRSHRKQLRTSFGGVTGTAGSTSGRVLMSWRTVSDDGAMGRLLVARPISGEVGGHLDWLLLLWQADEGFYCCQD